MKLIILIRISSLIMVFMYNVGIHVQKQGHLDHDARLAPEPRGWQQVICHRVFTHTWLHEASLCDRLLLFADPRLCLPSAVDWPGMAFCLGWVGA